VFKTGMNDVLREIQQNHQPILVVSNGRPRAVLQDVASYQETQDALALLKMLLLPERSIAGRRGSGTKAVAARLRARLRNRKSGS
jgi:prevent-host-death family protein